MIQNIVSPVQVIQFTIKKLRFFWKYFLDMSQYQQLFQSSRIPQLNCLAALESCADLKHTLVIVNGSFYFFDVYDENKRLFAPEYYFRCFQEFFCVKLRTQKKMKWES